MLATQPFRPESAVPTLILIRHGETPWNAEGRLQGLCEVAMSDHGRSQARRNGRALSAYLAATDQTAASLDWLSSPIGRARETMELVRDEVGLDRSAYALEERLRELTFGSWEGSTMRELKARDRPSVLARKADKWGFVPPDGESYADLSRRVAGWLEGLSRDTVAVTHGGVIRVLRGLLLAAPERHLPIRPVPQDRFLVIRAGVGNWL